MADTNLRKEILRLVPKPFATKKALAQAAGITETTLFNLLAGKGASSPTLAKLKRIGVRGLGKLVETFGDVA